MRQIEPIIAAVILSFLVCTQIELVHHLDWLSMVVAIIAVWLILMAADLATFRRRFAIGARLGFMFLLFVAIWATNSVSSLTKCSRDHTNCHRVLSF
jgi:hypothetical protein